MKHSPGVRNVAQSGARDAGARPFDRSALRRLVLPFAAVLGCVLAACGADRPDAAAGAGLFAPPGGGEPCTTEGAVEPCHERVGTHANVVTCIDGERFCYGGAWSACLQASGEIRSVQLPALGGGGSGAGAMLVPLALAPAATGCVDNPCDPNCMSSTVPGPFAGNGGGGFVVGTSGGFLANSNLPGNCKSTNGGATAYDCSGFKAKTTDPDGVCSECTQYDVPKNASVTLQQCQSACQSDQHCTGDGTDSCTAFSAGQKDWCVGADVTVPVGCLDASGREIISVCNRGTVDITSPIECCQFQGNSPHFADELKATKACAGGTYLGATAGTIKAGTCQSLEIDPSGNTSSIICNPHYTVAGTPHGVAECDPYNNWTAYKKGNSCTSMIVGGTFTPNVLTYEYEPRCDKPGSRLQWDYLTYDGQTPSAGGSTSSIAFEVQTQELTPSTLPASPFVTVASTAPPTNDPAVCPMSGVPGCPIDLFTKLGANANADKLTVRITLTPSCDITASPCEGTATPTLSSWQIMYSCLDAE